MNPGDFPTTRWPLDKFVWDEHRLPVLSGTPPGESQLSVGLYQLSTGQRAPVFDDAGRIVADQVMLNVPVRVIEPRVPPSLESLQMQGQVDRVYPGTRLPGWSLESATVQTPNFMRLTLFSQSELDTPLARPGRAELVDQTGQIVQTVTSPLAQGQRGFPLRTQIAFWLPPDFPTGRYGVRLNVLGEGTRPQVREGEAAIARAALGRAAVIETADLSSARLPPCDLAAILDVFLYLDPAIQDDLLARTTAALRPGGVLVVSGRRTPRPGSASAR